MGDRGGRRAHPPRYHRSRPARPRAPAPAAAQGIAARAVARLDHRERLALLPLDDPAARALVSPLPTEERYASWHFVWPDGRVRSRSAASIDLLAGLGRHRFAAAASRLERPLDAPYELVADHRDRVGLLVPDGAAPRRFP